MDRIGLTRKEIISDILEELKDMGLSGKKEFLEKLSNEELTEFRKIVIKIQFVRYFISIGKIEYIWRLNHMKNIMRKIIN